MSANERSGRRRKPPAPELCHVPCFKAELVAELRAAMPSDQALDQMRVRFVALADRTRLKVLYALVEGGELCVCDVAHAIGMSVSASSHHLRKLRDLEILRYRNDGKMAYYSVADRVVVRLVKQAIERSAA